MQSVPTAIANTGFTPARFEAPFRPANALVPRALHRVLLVEDDPVLALALEDALRRAGALDVENCATAKAAFHALEKGARPTAVILDVHLADRSDGWAIAEVISLLGPQPPRIVFCTGAPEEIPADVARLGPIFQKPYDTERLVKMLADDRKSGLFTRLRAHHTSAQ